MKDYKKVVSQTVTTAVVADEEQVSQNFEYTYDENVDKEEFPVPVNYSINESST